MLLTLTSLYPYLDTPLLNNLKFFPDLFGQPRTFDVDQWFIINTNTWDFIQVDYICWYCAQLDCYLLPKISYSSNWHLNKTSLWVQGDPPPKHCLWWFYTLGNIIGVQNKQLGTQNGLYQAMNCYQYRLHFPPAKIFSRTRTTPLTSLFNTIVWYIVSKAFEISRNTRNCK